MTLPNLGMQAKRCLERGAEQVTVDNLSIPGEHAGQWQERVVRRLVDELGLSKLMFEAPHPEEILDFKVVCTRACSTSWQSTTRRSNRHVYENLGD